MGAKSCDERRRQMSDARAVSITDIIETKMVGLWDARVADRARRTAAERLTLDASTGVRVEHHSAEGDS